MLVIVLYFYTFGLVFILVLCIGWNCRFRFIDAGRVKGISNSSVISGLFVFEFKFD